MWIRVVLVSVLEGLQGQRLRLFKNVQFRTRLGASKINQCPILSRLPTRVVHEGINGIVRITRQGLSVQRVFYLRVSVLVRLLRLMDLQFGRSINQGRSIHAHIRFHFLVLRPTTATRLSIVNPMYATVLYLHLRSLIRRIPSGSPLRIQTIMGRLPRIFSVSITISLHVHVLARSMKAHLTKVTMFLRPTGTKVRKACRIHVPIFPYLLGLRRTIKIMHLRTLMLVIRRFSITTLVAR